MSPRSRYDVEADTDQAAEDTSDTWLQIQIRLQRIQIRLQRIQIELLLDIRDALAAKPYPATEALQAKVAGIVAKSYGDREEAIRKARAAADYVGETYYVERHEGPEYVVTMTPPSRSDLVYTAEASGRDILEGNRG